jgi:cell division protein FtsL
VKINKKLDKIEHSSENKEKEIDRMKASSFSLRVMRRVSEKLLYFMIVMANLRYLRLFYVVL